MFWFIYLTSITYCLWRIIKSYKRTFFDAAVGPTPGLDTLVVIVFAPILATVDLSVTWIRLVKEAEEAKRRSNKIF